MVYREVNSVSLSESRHSVIWLIVTSLILLVLSEVFGRSPVELVVRSEDAGLFSSKARMKILEVAEEAIIAAKQRLIGIPDRIVLVAHHDHDVIEALGTRGSAVREAIYWGVDTRRTESVHSIAGRHLKATMLHEMHHLVREASVKQPARCGPFSPLVGQAVFEGAASAFERRAAELAPWAYYDQDVTDLAQELFSQSTTVSMRDWMFEHPDGRKWIGFRVGAYLVDCALASGSFSEATLAMASVENIIFSAYSECPELVMTRNKGGKL